MLNETYSDRSMFRGQPVVGVISISGDEYSDLIRAAAQLDMLLTLVVHNGYCDTSLVRSIAKERGITAERKVEEDGNRETVLLDEAQRELHDLGHD